MAWPSPSPSGRRCDARHVEAHVHQRLDQMHGEAGMHRIVARAFVLEEAPGGSARTIPESACGSPRAARSSCGWCRRNRSRTRDGNPPCSFRSGRRPCTISASRLAVGERLRHALDGVARDVLPGDEVRGRHHMRHLRVGLLQQLAIGDRAAVLVAVLDLLVGLDEALQRLVGGEQHRRVRRAEPEHDLGHD